MIKDLVFDGGVDANVVQIFRMPGANTYCITSAGGKNLLAAIDFQNGPLKESELNGILVEHLLLVAIDRLECYQSGEFPCQHNHMSLACLKEALKCLEARTADRQERGVEGKSEA